MEGQCWLKSWGWHEAGGKCMDSRDTLKVESVGLAEKLIVRGQ